MERTGVRAARPQLIRASVATVIAVAGLVAANLFGQREDETFREGGRLVLADPASATERVLLFGGAALFLFAGVGAVRSSATAIRVLARLNEAEARGASLSFVASLTGYLIVVLATLGIVGVNLEGLLVGGALTGVVVGIAAQQTIGNFFAGIVLMAAKPFVVGDPVVIRSGALGGEYEGIVTDMSLFYVRMTTELGPVHLPNSGVIAAAVGPGARKPPEEPVTTEESAAQGRKS